jgi:hypothetical protein
MSWLIVWAASGSLSFLSYALVSFWFDRNFVASTWIKIGLAGVALLGPLGCLLTLWFLVGLIRDLRRDLNRRGLKRYPRPRKICDNQSRTHYFPLFATRRLVEEQWRRNASCLTGFTQSSNTRQTSARYPSVTYLTRR